MTAYPIRELFFEYPEKWVDTRTILDYFCYYDHLLDKNFDDTELSTIFSMLDIWDLPLALEVAVLKSFIRTGVLGYRYGHEMWSRFQDDCGAVIELFAMDEPYWAVVEGGIGSGDLTYAVEQTAIWMQLVRNEYPEALIVSIEPYPVLTQIQLQHWVDSLDAECERIGITGIDGFSVDPDWNHWQFVWDDILQLEAFCEARGIPFSLIYWAADATDSTAVDQDWYDGVMMQGAAYNGSPDEYVIQSWTWVPRVMTPDYDDSYSFTRSVIDFHNTYVR